MEINACKSCQFYSLKKPTLEQMEKQPKAFHYQLLEIERIMKDSGIFDKERIINENITAAHHCEYLNRFISNGKYMNISNDGCDLHVISHSIYMSVYLKDKEKARALLDVGAQNRLRETYPFLR